MSRILLSFRLIALILMMCAVLPASAQDSGDGTIYSRFGVGDLQFFSSSRINAMGGGGVAMYSPNYLNLSNPASLGRQILTRISIGAKYVTLEASDAAAEESLLQSGGLTAVQFGLPVLADELGLGISFRPYSLVNYRVVQGEGIVVDPVTGDTSLYRVGFEGGGGLQQIRAGAGYRLTDELSLGASADFVFGLFEDRRQTSFPGSALDPTQLARATRLFGVTGSAGALYSRMGILAEEDYVSAGLSFTLPARLAGRQVLTLGESLNPDTLLIDGEPFLEGDITLPWRLSAGLAYEPDARWVFVVNGVYQPWSRFESDFATRRFEENSGTTTFSDRFRASAGIQVLPAGTETLAPYYARIAYRLGAYYDQSYVNPVTDASLQTVALTAGMSLPTVFSGTRIDLSMEAGLRGTTNHALVRDRYLKVSAQVNIGERWFLDRRVR